VSGLPEFRSAASGYPGGAGDVCRKMFGGLLSMSNKPLEPEQKPSVTLPGIVEKIIKPIHPSLPEKAQISFEGPDYLYREIRIDNVLKDAHGEPVALKPGAEVHVTVEADLDKTTGG
jgi:hypothetical protein